MARPDPAGLALLAVRRALGVTAFLYLFYVAAHYLWGQAFPTPGDLLAVMAVVAGGVALGVAFAHVWPLPAEPGFGRVVRTVLITIPALGIGIALQVFIAGAEAERAFYVAFALAAWLGSGLIREEEADAASPPSLTETLFGRDRADLDPDPDPDSNADADATREER